MFLTGGYQDELIRLVNQHIPKGLEPCGSPKAVRDKNGANHLTILMFSSNYQDKLTTFSINKHIQEGWELWGSPSVVIDGNGNNLWIQAMVKKTCS